MAKHKRWGKRKKYKRDWKSYNAKLIRRGEFYINPTFLETWLDEIEVMNSGKIGQPYLYPESLIKFLSFLKCKGFSLRDLQGSVSAFSKKLGPFPVISFSQIRRRILSLELRFGTNKSNLIVGCDGSGLKVGNRGDWMREKWKVKRGWIKVVIMGDIDGNIVDIRIGNEDLDERKSVRGMIRKRAKNIKKVLLDGLHDVEDTFNLCDQKKIDPGIKIRKNACDEGLSPRPREVRKYKKKGYNKWAKEKEYGMRWPSTEGIFSSVKVVFGEEISSHKTRNMYHEAKLKFWAYQKLNEIA